MLESNNDDKKKHIQTLIDLLYFTIYYYLNETKIPEGDNDTENKLYSPVQLNDASKGM